MIHLSLNRRSVVAGLLLSSALGIAPAFAQGAPKPYDVTPELIEAAKKEGTITFYTATDVSVAEGVGKAFEAKYPGIKVKVERSGSERVFQRISQEYGSNIHNADVIETSDAVHFLLFKKQGWLAQAVPAEVAKDWPADAKDPDGHYAAYRAHLSVIGYNTQQVKAEEAPKSHADLLDPKWRGRMVKAHPGYSGTIMTATDALSRTLGWEYFEKLGKQRIMQVQSSTEPPKKLAQGERSIQADGNEYAGLLKNAPHPNAAKLFYSFIFDLDTQQLNHDVGGLRSFHPGVKEKASRTPLSKIKVLYSDPVKLEPEIENIKKKYEEYFGT
jgi:iron(III) transport system substrate-binding protein